MGNSAPLSGGELVTRCGANVGTTADAWLAGAGLDSAAQQRAFIVALAEARDPSFSHSGAPLVVVAALLDSDGEETGMNLAYMGESNLHRLLMAVYDAGVSDERAKWEQASEEAKHASYSGPVPQALPQGGGEIEC